MSTTHTIRTATGTKSIDLTPLKAMRLKCLDCCCWQVVEVRECADKLCPLHPYRMGHKPTEAPVSDDLDDNGDSW